MSPTRSRFYKRAFHRRNIETVAPFISQYLINITALFHAKQSMPQVIARTFWRSVVLSTVVQIYCIRFTGFLKLSPEVCIQALRSFSLRSKLSVSCIPAFRDLIFSLLAQLNFFSLKLSLTVFWLLSNFHSWRLAAIKRSKKGSQKIAL